MRGTWLALLAPQAWLRARSRWMAQMVACIMSTPETTTAALLSSRIGSARED
jgi:hypothetical protein